MMDLETIISFALIYNDPLKKADAIILLEGDGFCRIKKTVQLFRDGWAPRIVISGGVDNRGYGSFPARELRKKLIQTGIPTNKIALDEQSLNTRDQAVEIMQMTRKKKWESIIIVGTHYHQPRAFLTFLQVMKEAKIKVKIINAPEKDISWFKANPWGRRVDLMRVEAMKIEEYRKRGHIAAFKDVISYQKWKESQ